MHSCNFEKSFVILFFSSAHKQQKRENQCDANNDKDDNHERSIVEIVKSNVLGCHNNVFFVLVKNMLFLSAN